MPQTFTGRNRIPVLMLGPLLNLTGEAFVPLVGGDRIGPRPLDFHIKALTAMGAQITVDDTGIHATARRLRGTKVTLPYPSVGATESVMLSAVLAEGRTVITNAAVEPEIMELALFLQRMGAGIQLQPDRRILIEGVETLHGAATRLAGDRLEAFSYLVAGLLTGGQVRVHGCAQDRLVTAIETLRKMGTQFEIDETYITASAPDGLRSAAVHTDTHPGFTTDWQQPLLVLMSQARGLVGAARDGVREPVRVRRGAAATRLRDRAVPDVPGRQRVPFPRHQPPALGGGTRPVEAGRRGGARTRTCAPATPR